MKISPRRMTHPLREKSGIYVIDMVGAVKVGKANDLRLRLIHHRANGATRGWAFIGTSPNPFPFPRTVSQLERTALHLVAIYGGRPLPGTSETFTDISFDDAVQAVEDLCTPRGVSKVAIDFSSLTTPIKKRRQEAA